MRVPKDAATPATSEMANAANDSRAITLRNLMKFSFRLFGGGGQPVFSEAFPQDELLYLPRGGVRDFVDEDDVVRYPPFGDFAFEILQNFFFGELCAGLQYDNQQWPFVPFRVTHANDCSLGN